MERKAEGNVENEELVRQAVFAPEQFASKWNELLSRFDADLPAERLRSLLLSPKAEAVLGGLFIVDEIAERAHPVLAEVVPLAQHADPRIRLGAYQALWSCAGNGQEAVFVHALRGLLDSDASCRIGAMHIVARAKQHLFDAVLPLLGEADVGLRDGVEGLLGSASEQTSLITKWRRMEPVYRRFAAIAAARDEFHWVMLAGLVRSCEDADIREFTLQFTRRRVAYFVKKQAIIERAVGMNADLAKALNDVERALLGRDRMPGA